MITHEAIRHEIHDIMEKPMNRECVRVLADLVYLDRHYPTFGYKEVKEMHANHDLTKDEIVDWVMRLRDMEGNVGPHWTMEQVRQVMMQYGITTDSVEFWAVMNMLYSDYAGVAKKHGVNNSAFFTDMAKAWLDDVDAQPEKLSKYFMGVVKHW